MTYEEMKQYADDHWKSVVLCRECKHLRLCDSLNDWCSLLNVRVIDDFWCGYGEKKGKRK